MENGKVFIWMNLLGFDRNDADRGVSRFLEQTGFKPDGVSALLCSADFFHQHRGMEEEYTLPPDNCAYWGIPKNSERERQSWTNYDLRALSKNLKEKGVELYADIFGVPLNNAFHDEWIYEHPEIFKHGKDGEKTHGTMFVLKRFKDGSYYQDFFIDKVCKTLIDYDMAGVHLADYFCPPDGGMLHSMEFSSDFVEQFVSHSGVSLPNDIQSEMGIDSKAAETKRAEYIYKNLRSEWIEFNAWRWERFFEELCRRVHKIGKKVTALAMYCTDPFETLYCIGIDLSRLVRAGVDYITANILPTSCYIGGKDERPLYFEKYMAIAPTVAAHVPKGHLVSMLGIQDAAEEWSAMHHAPTMHERDIYTMMAYQLIDGDGVSRALDGYYLCLGDGIKREDWDAEGEKLRRAMTANGAERVISPAMYWSDYAFSGMVKEYIKTRRWTPHKYFYELMKAGAYMSACVRPEGLKNYTGALFVPNFDMLSEEEREEILAYGGPVLATAKKSFDLSGINTELDFTDAFSNTPMTAFVLNSKIDEAIRTRIEELVSEDDGHENLNGDLENIEEPTYTLNDTLVFAKLTDGFLKAMALVLEHITPSPFKINKPNITLKMKDGGYRLYLFNDSLVKYHRAFVKADRAIVSSNTVSTFPILPPRFMKDAKGELHHIYRDDAPKQSFEIKIQPAGVTVIDVYLKK